MWYLFLPSLLLAWTRAVSGQSNATVNLTSLELFWSYGHSPAVYPSPIGQGLGNWKSAYEQASAIVAQMTNDEKSNLTYGYDSTTLAEISGCVGLTFGVPRLNIPGICFADAGNGVRAAEMVTAYPAGLHVAASWNRSLAYTQAYYMGKEFKAKGINVVNGPVVSPLGRTALGGRNWEGLGADPYLAGQLVGETVEGLQKSVITAVKHYIGYEQETQRTGTDGNQSYSSNIDDRTMHELYLWPFMDAVHSGTGAVMCSYNRINDSYACQNSKTQNGLLKTELGFQGFLVSDWNAQLAGIASSNAGLDLAMPDSSYWDGPLAQAVANGTLSQERLDDMAIRIMAAWYKLAPFEEPGFGMPSVVAGVDPSSMRVDARDLASRSTVFQGAVEGHVLVKNIDNALPLSSPKILSVFGYDAGSPPKVNPVGSIAWYLGYESINITDNESLVSLDSMPETAKLGTLICGGGSGANTPSYIKTPLAALTDQAADDGTFLEWDIVNTDPTVSSAIDACLVFINEFAGEGLDRPGLADAASNELINNVASQCSNTIVIIHNAGIRLVDDWIENDNVTAVIFAHLPGQDSGSAIVEILYGRQSPSGRLPYTVAKRAEDYGSLLEPVGVQADSPYYPQVNYTEGVDIDYRSFIKRNITPRYEFGYGLTYSSFSYTNLAFGLATNSCLSSQAPGSVVAEGGLPSLWETVATVEVDLTNVGNYTASEVAQLYVGVPGGPQKTLRGFAKENLDPQASSQITFELTRRDLSTWDIISQNWILTSGSYEIYVGASVLDIRLAGSLSLHPNQTCS